MNVMLIHASTGGVEWTGTLAEFFEANREVIDDAERSLVVKILNGGGVYYYGGGAGPLLELKAAKPLASNPPNGETP